jgi:hypothetical protein
VKKFTFGILGLVLGLCANSVNADELKTDPKDPEIFNLKIEPYVGRCLEDASGLDHCTKADGLEVQSQLALSDCGGDNAYGKNCGGAFEKTITIDDVKYLLRADVTHFVNPNFKYMISVWVCRDANYETCGRSTLYLKDANVPAYDVSGPITNKGKIGDDQLWYNAVLHLGEAPPMR